MLPIPSRLGPHLRQLLPEVTLQETCRISRYAGCELMGIINLRAATSKNYTNLSRYLQGMPRPFKSTPEPEFSWGVSTAKEQRQNE